MIFRLLHQSVEAFHPKELFVGVFNCNSIASAGAMALSDKIIFEHWR